MTAKYQVVWVDDSSGWVDSVLADVEECISGHGFIPNIVRLESGEGFEELCESMDLDLIIVDYNLSLGRNGGVLISQLRESGIFKEVIFYSFSQIPSDVVIGAGDRVFQTIRDDAVDEIKKVIELTVHMRRDLEVVRGLIIASTIDLEVRLEELMVTVFGESGDLFQKTVLNKPIYDFAKKMMFVQSHIKDVIAIADEGDKERLKTMQDKLKEFKKDVVDPRNILAHARQISNGGKVTLCSNDGRSRIKFDDEWLSKTRQKLREHMGNLKKIQAFLRE